MVSTRPLRRRLVHRLLLRLAPERAHDLVIGALALASRSQAAERWLRRRFAAPGDERLRQDLLGRTFTNPIGLAAGFDKNGRAARALAALGFGFIELGTVTPQPQAGNPKPRLFRHPRLESLQNELGFNNDGMAALYRRLDGDYPFPFPIGLNVGKNATTPLERAASDYQALFRHFARHTDYFVINVSSPNTPGLRDLQTPDRLATLIGLGAGLTDRPILVKLSPDLSGEMAVALGRAAVGAGAAGIIVTNTTTDYRLVPGAAERGGLSGRVLRARSFAMLQALAAELFGRTLLISVGGIDSGEEVYRRLRAGASLVQAYTALVYRGPELVSAALGRLLDLMERDGARTLSDIVGADVKLG